MRLKNLILLLFFFVLCVLLICNRVLMIFSMGRQTANCQRQLVKNKLLSLCRFSYFPLILVYNNRFFQFYLFHFAKETRTSRFDLQVLNTKQGAKVIRVIILASLYKYRCKMTDIIQDVTRSQSFFFIFQSPLFLI